MNYSHSFQKNLQVMSKTLLSLFLPLLAATSIGFAFVESSSISGTVKNKAGEPIPFANVSLLQKETLVSATTTDIEGNYSIKEIPQGKYDIKVQCIGYKTITRSGIEIKTDINMVENFELEISETKLDEIVITEEKMSSPIESLTSFFSVSKSETRVASGKGSASKPAAMAYDAAPARAISGDYEYKAADIAGAREGEEMRKYEEASVKLKRDLSEKETKAKLMAEPEKYSSAGKLTAGNWCDNRNWDFFTGVLKKDDWSKMKETWKFNPEERYVVKVKNGKDIAQDVPVRMKDRSGKVIWETRTDNKGEAFLFANIFEKEEKVFEVEVGDKTNFISQTIGRTPETVVEIDFSTAAKPAKTLDVMFMIDATGSMGDEMEYIAEELNDVIARVKRAQQQMLTVRVSNNVYRDKGDDYVVRSFPFTDNMSVALSQLNEQSAGGGGDYEEAVEEAFADAINKHEWSSSAAARLMFFVLDAPPHQTNENIKKIQEVTKTAAAKGIRVIPVASSGVDKNTEFLMRFLSVSTGGTYVFLTDHSGIGNSHIEPTIGKYDVEYLNDLLVKVINSYLQEEELMTKK